MKKFITDIWALAVVPLMAALAAFHFAQKLGIGYAGAVALCVGGYYVVTGNIRWRWFFTHKQRQLTATTAVAFLFTHSICCLLPVVLAIQCHRILKSREPYGAEFRNWVYDRRRRDWAPMAIPAGVGITTELFLLGLSAPLPRRKKEKEEVEEKGTVRRGRRILSQQEATRIADAARQQSDREAGRTVPHPGIFWGGLFLPPESADLGYLALGAPRTGKSVSINLVAQGVLAGMARGEKVRALWNDWKSDSLPLLSAMGLPWKTLNPEDRRGVGWAIAKDITTAKHSRALVNVLFPKSEGKTGDEGFFERGSRALARAVVVTFVEIAPECWTLKDVIHTLRNRERLEAVLELTAQGREAKKLYLSKEKTFLDILSTLANLTDDYLEIAAAWDKPEEQISLMDWIRGNFVLVLGNSPTDPEIFKRLNAVIFKRASQLLLKHLPLDGSDRTWIFLDELSQMGKLDGLHALAREGGSRGVALVLGTQDVEGLEDELGEKKAHEVLGMCRNVAVFGLGSPHTAEFAAKLFGQKEVEEEKISRSDGGGPGGTSWNISTSSEVAVRDAVLASQFLNQPAPKTAGGLSGYFLSPIVGAWKAFIPFLYLVQNLAKPHPDVAAHIERDADELRPAPWSLEDVETLGLPAALAESGDNGGTQALPSGSTERPRDTAPADNVIDLDRRRKLRDVGRRGRRKPSAPSDLEHPNGRDERQQDANEG